MLVFRTDFPGNICFGFKLIANNLKMKTVNQIMRIVVKNEAKNVLFRRRVEFCDM